MDHVDYPHTPGYLYDCPACEAECFCTPGSAQCVATEHEMSDDAEYLARQETLSDRAAWAAQDA